MEQRVIRGGHCAEQEDHHQFACPHVEGKDVRKARGSYPVGLIVEVGKILNGHEKLWIEVGRANNREPHLRAGRVPRGGDEPFRMI